MTNYPKIGIRPIIDGRRRGVRESLEDQTMNMAKRVAALYEAELRYPDGSPVQVVIADTTIGRVPEAQAAAVRNLQAMEQKNVEVARRLLKG